MDQATNPEIYPSPSTGIDEIPATRKERILQFVHAALAAKEAGVAGEPIRHVHGFVDQVTRQRVADARNDVRWPARLAEMDSDEASWTMRIADRAPRALMRKPDAAPAAAAAMRLIRRAGGLSSDERQLLADSWDETVLRDIDRTQELLPSLVQPELASLRWRAFAAVRDVPSADEFRRVAQHQSTAVYAAAAAIFAGDRLSPPLRAILLGPWAAVIDGDPTELEAAWSDEADDLRSDFTTLDPAAWTDPSESF
ncbi:MAG: hypothetical protein ACSLFN_15345 [Candidatus Limnocylindrales bacterium]